MQLKKVSAICLFLLLFAILFFLSGCVPPLGETGQYTTGPTNPPGNLAEVQTGFQLNPSTLRFLASDQQKSLSITVTDQFVNKRLYLCTSPCTSISNWNNTINFTGTAYGTSNWLNGEQGITATLILDRNMVNNGNNYLAYYSCQGIGLCHDNKWVKVPFIINFDLPDLIVDSITIGEPIGTNFPVTIKIKNTGLGNSFNSVVPLVVAYTIGYTDLPQQTPATTSFTINQDLAPNYIYEKAILIPLGESLNIKVNASVDITGQNPESFEDNNHKSELFTFVLQSPGPIGELSTVPPRPLACSLKTACSSAGETEVLQLSDPVNAHAALPFALLLPALPANNYPQKVCCSNGNGPITVGSGNAFAYLSDTNNSHVILAKYTAPGEAGLSLQELELRNLFKTEAKMSIGGVKTMCMSTTESCSILGFDTCLVSTTDYLNAHAGACGSANHPYNLCCALLNTTNLCYGKVEGFPCDQNKICRNGACQ